MYNAQANMLLTPGSKLFIFNVRYWGTRTVADGGSGNCVLVIRKLQDRDSHIPKQIINKALRADPIVQSAQKTKERLRDSFAGRHDRGIQGACSEVSWTSPVEVWLSGVRGSFRLAYLKCGRRGDVVEVRNHLLLSSQSVQLPIVGACALLRCR